MKRLAVVAVAAMVLFSASPVSAAVEPAALLVSAPVTATDEVLTFERVEVGSEPAPVVVEEPAVEVAPVPVYTEPVAVEEPVPVLLVTSAPEPTAEPVVPNTIAAGNPVCIELGLFTAPDNSCIQPTYCFAIGEDGSCQLSDAPREEELTAVENSDTVETSAGTTGSTL